MKKVLRWCFLLTPVSGSLVHIVFGSDLLDPFSGRQNSRTGFMHIYLSTQVQFNQETKET